MTLTVKRYHGQLDFRPPQASNGVDGVQPAGVLRGQPVDGRRPLLAVVDVERCRDPHAGM